MVELAAYTATKIRARTIASEGLRGATEQQSVHDLFRSCYMRPMPMPPGPVPTLHELREAQMWLWLYCAHCPHSRAILIVHAMIALGVNASSDRLRATALCPACGKRGAQTYVPSHVDSATAAAPFPMSQ
jgi:hypothetical protein